MLLEMQVIGHLGGDATIKEHNGKSVINFSVAHTERFKRQDGTQVDRTTWVECSMWERDNLAKWLTKGKLIYLEGKPAANAFTTKEGELKASIRLNVFKLIFLEKKQENTPTNASGGEAPSSGSASDQPADDLPF